MMSTIPHFLFHTADTASPFAEAIAKVADSDQVRLVCPYINLDILHALIDDRDDWSLITDLAEWCASKSGSERKEMLSFVTDHRDSIRDLRGVHAKLVLSDTTAYFGSANLTRAGLTRNHENDGRKSRLRVHRRP